MGGGVLVELKAAVARAYFIRACGYASIDVAFHDAPAAHAVLEPLKVWQALNRAFRHEPHGCVVADMAACIESFHAELVFRVGGQPVERDGSGVHRCLCRPAVGAQFPVLVGIACGGRIGRRPRQRGALVRQDACDKVGRLGVGEIFLEAEVVQEQHVLIGGVFDRYKPCSGGEGVFILCPLHVLDGDFIAPRE